MLSNKKYIQYICLLIFFMSFFILVETESRYIMSPVLIEMVIFPNVELPMNITVIVDNVSLLFFVTVSLISMVVLTYSYMYMSEELKFNKFVLILSWFIFSMFTLSMSGNVFWSIVGWDLLGLSSYCLIIFYSNWSSLNSGMYTFLMNRVGDVFFISLIWWCMMTNSSLSFSNLEESVTGLLFLLTGISKSAQVPFSFWLPLAMAAPTPVSALVHSSTLVTAGIFLFIRFFHFLSYNSLIILNFISCLTVILASSSALVEMDLKKIIALSTLSHLGLIMIFISIGSLQSAMTHLICHAFFKSLIFMLAGVYIHENMNIQDIRSLCTPLSMSSNCRILSIISFSSMMGVPFLTGFYSKELMLLSLESGVKEVFTYMCFNLGVGLTAAYSVRIMLFLENSVSYSSMEPTSLSLKMVNYLLMYSMMSIIQGAIILWQYFLQENQPEINQSSFFMKSFMILMIIMGFLVGAYFYKKLPSYSSASFFMNLWFINSIWESSQIFTISSSSTLNLYSDTKGLNQWLFSKLMSTVNMVTLPLKSNGLFKLMMMLNTLCMTLLVITNFKM